MLFVIGGGDHLYTPDEVEQIAQRLDADHLDHEMIVYSDTPHGFFCHERDSYRHHEAEDAFARLTALFSRTLPQSA